jgi:hypothetical protein
VTLGTSTITSRMALGFTFTRAAFMSVIVMFWHFYNKQKFIALSRILKSGKKMANKTKYYGTRYRLMCVQKTRKILESLIQKIRECTKTAKIRVNGHTKVPVVSYSSRRDPHNHNLAKCTQKSILYEMNGRCKPSF